MYKTNKTVVSFEIFPPKKDVDIAAVYNAIDGLNMLKPDFISVTFGAGGMVKGSNITADIAQHIKDEYGIEALTHLTCAGLDAAGVDAVVDDFRHRGVKNILALRGDDPPSGSFEYAKDLIFALNRHGGFCIGAAAYPEGHISCDNLDKDILHLKQKQDSGADFFITQLFFDNAIFYKFLEKTRAAGITKPVSAGVMPILGRAQIERMIFMCGASLPAAIIKIINKYDGNNESLAQAGVEYSCRQMQDLCANAVQGIHIYTMNKPYIAEYCLENLRIGRV